MEQLKELPDEKNLNPHLAYYLKAAEKLAIGYKVFSTSTALFRPPGKEHFFIMTTGTPLNSGASNLVKKYKHIVYEILKLRDISQPMTFWSDSLAKCEGFIHHFKEPFVVKPTSGLGGRDVFVGVETPEEVEKAFNTIQKRYKAAKGDEKARTVVLMQNFLQGENYRAIVLGKKRIISVIKRLPAKVDGDGKSTIRKLIDVQNEYRLSTTPALPPIRVDEFLKNTLAEQGLNLDSVPKKDERVFVHKVANLSKGGTVINIDPKTLHEDLKEELLEAAVLMDLGLAAVDFITTDVTKSLKETGGGINEMNSNPGLRNHYFAEGNTVDIALEIMKEIVDTRKPANIS